MRCECPEIVHTRQRKAPLRGAALCANAHTASVGAVESASTLAEKSSLFRRFGGEIKCCEMH